MHHESMGGKCFNENIQKQLHKQVQMTQNHILTPIES
jgi:hypothetical protein